MAPKKSEPRSALEALDDPEPPEESTAPVAALEPLPVPLEPSVSIDISDAGLQEQLEEALLAAIDDVATGDQHALLCAHGLASRGRHAEPRRKLEEFRLNRLRSCVARAMAPEDLAAEKLRLELLKPEVSRRIDELNAELAECMRRVRAEVQKLETSLAEPERKISEAETALKEIRERAPDSVVAMRSQMLRAEWEPRRLAAQTLRVKVDAIQRTLTEDGPEYYALQGRNSEHPAAELVREMFQAGAEKQADHCGNLQSVIDRQRQVLKFGLPALRERLKSELPGLQQQLAQAEADELAAKARCDAPMELHVRKWLARKPSAV